MKPESAGESRPNARAAAAKPINRALGLRVLFLAYGLFTAVMVLQVHFNLWALSTITVVVMSPLIWRLYGEQLGHFFRISPKRLFNGLACGVALVMLSYALFPLFSRIWPELLAEIKVLYQQIGVWPGRFWAMPVIFLLVLVEEIIWRGLLFDLLKPRFQGLMLIAVCTLLFPVPHLLTGNFVLGIAALFLGAVTTYQRYRWDNILAPFLTHMIWNLAIMVFFPLVPQI